MGLFFSVFSRIQEQIMARRFQVCQAVSAILSWAWQPQISLFLDATSWLFHRLGQMFKMSQADLIEWEVFFLCLSRFHAHPIQGPIGADKPTFL